MNILDYYEYAKLASAAYVEMDAYNGVFTGAQFAAAANSEEQKRMPGALANQTFVFNAENNTNPWTIPPGGYHGNDASGFAATLFLRGTEKVLAIRGTEPNSSFNVYTDLLKADLQELGEYGMAISQTVSLYNYVQRLMAPSAKGDVAQLQIHTGLIPPTPAERSGDYVTAPGVPPKFIWVTKTYTGQGLGELIKYGDNLTLTGHSLGGHLAAIGARLFPTLFSKGAITFNAPGYDPLAGVSNLFPSIPMPTAGKQLTDEFINTLFSPNLEEAPAGGFAGRVTTIESEDAIPGDDFDGVSGNGTGNPFSLEKYITTEKVSHDIGHLMDGLAIQALMVRMNSNLNASQTGKIVEAASASTGESYEILLDKLILAISGQTVTVQRTEPGGLMIDGGSIDARRDYYTKLVDLEKKIKENTSLRLESILEKSPDAIVNLARNGDIDALAYRYALKELNPFAILGVDYSRFNQNGELNLYDKTTGKGELTESWLTDRAAMLANVIQANLADTGSGKNLRVDTYRNDPIYFKDEANGLSLQQINPVTGESTGPQYRFGGNGNDTLWGKDTNDHLYGGAGMDRLDGGKGNDTLEGNAGSDILSGGKGSDTLNGGLGDDTYTIGGGDGWDWLEDQDGIGKILYADSQGGADIQLTGGTPVEGTANVWKQESNGQTFWYLLTDWTENGQTFQRLSIEGPDGGVFVKAWRAGQLGITLPGALAQTPAPAVLVGTAGTDKLHAQHNEAVIAGHGGADLLEAGSVSTALYADDVIPNLTQYVADTAQLAGGGTLAPGAPQTGSVLIGSHGGDDTLVGGSGNDALFGGAGRDQLIGGGGADLILGDGIYHPLLTPGDGAYTGWQLGNQPGQFAIVGYGMTDPLYAYADHDAPNDDADIIHGGGGNDMAWGGFGDDLIYGEGGDDWLVGASGSDLIDGGDGNDLLVGEADTFEGPAGNDILLGGRGNDNLYGYTGNDRLLGGDNNDLLIGDMPSGLGIGVDGSLDGNDFLDGESGNDTLFGGGKDDELYGGSGDDYLNGDGSEIIGAYMGKDTLYGGDGNDELTGDGNDDRLFGGNDDDRLFGDNSTTPLANQGNDTLDGGNGNDYLRGYGGDDILLGGAGVDSLLGDAGNDQLDGGDANDVLVGGGAKGVLEGGAGNDKLWGDAALTPLALGGMLRSTGKNGQKRNVFGPFDVADNDDLWGGRSVSDFYMPDSAIWGTAA